MDSEQIQNLKLSVVLGKEGRTCFRVLLQSSFGSQVGYDEKNGGSDGPPVASDDEHDQIDDRHFLESALTMAG